MSNIKPETYQGIRSQEGLDMIADSSPITVHVGISNNIKIWHFPKKLLTTNSTFFAAALDSGFAEGFSKTVTLPEQVPGEFEVWIQWLYLGDLAEIGGDQWQDFEGCKKLVRMWVLGDVLGCPMFQDEAMICTIKSIDVYGLYRGLLAFIWDSCAPGSKMRKFAVDQCVVNVRLGHLDGDADEEATYIQFAEENEDFAKAYVTASIRQGDCEVRRLNSCCGAYLTRPEV